MRNIDGLIEKIHGVVKSHYLGTALMQDTCGTIKKTVVKWESTNTAVPML